MVNSSKTKTILIVEDEKPMARALELKLTKEGYNTKVAFDGEEALKALSKEAFDLILLDLVLPRVDGFDVLKEVRAKYNGKTAVIVLSNLGQEEDVRRAKEMEVADYFVKSNTSIVEVINRVKQVLKS